MDLIESLEWRYASKKMNGQKVPPEKVDNILKAIQLTPSSMGLQPYNVIVISDRAVKQKILPIANNQMQVLDSSHLLVFAAWDTYTPDRIRGAFEQTRRDRGEISEYWASYGKVLEESYPLRDAEVNFQHAARQAYLGLGFALLAAAAEGVDSTPMEGFAPVALDELLGLRDKGLRSVLLMPLGYRDAEADRLAGVVKSRRPLADFARELAS